ncbi:uncharacterized protein EDB93DRAFT_1247622 [Suillus bovinus]|uniref:uncharacterized protein n=1 Tax=Suillus bovinus TaxID=48563 RepID=UPI001B86F674|nr:uncharacterized protein EDB93DRAFT_1247622 [Suillus bovinus]KAG2155977.1 hypothetical protein EDB93DRAFT_1247622 [Suillus bovinus]
MSTLVDTSLTGLKEITAKIMAIITGAWQLPPGHSHFSLTTQVSTLVADVVQHYGSGPYLLGLVCSCSRELIRVRGMTPQVWPNWHSISKVLAWEELGDHTFDLPVVASPSIGPIPVDLPPSPGILPTLPPSPGRREKVRQLSQDLEPEVEGSRKRKSPMIPALPSQPPKSTMKTRKQAKTTGLAKFKVFVESEDEEDLVTQCRRSSSPSSPQMLQGRPDHLRSPQSSKKKPFGPATEVIEPPQATPEPPVEAPPVIDAGDILIPGPNNPCQACHKMEWPCTTRFDKRTGAPCMSCIYCTTKKMKCISMRGPDPGPLPKLPPKLQLPHNPLAGRRVNLGSLPSFLVYLMPKHQRRKHCGRSKTVTAAKEPTPAPALPSSTSGVPHSALNVPMPDLHAMAMAIWEGAARITALEECVHPTFPLLDAQGDATSFLLHQPVPPAMSTPASTLPPFIDLSMEGTEPNPPNLQDESAIDGLIFELNQIHPEVSQMPSKIVKLDDPSNLFPEYDSVEEMDVQVKGEPSGEDVDMTT